MRTALLSIPFILLASTSFAQAMPNSLSMSCSAARGLVQQNGAVVIGTGPNLYDRFVTSTGKCEPTQRSEPAWIPTADQAQCLVGRRCIARRFKLH